MNINPKVSVIITTHNRLDFLKRATLSVLKQTYDNIELIISDDCSDYDLTDLINELKSISRYPIIYRRNNSNLGACYTRNEGIRLSTGEFITGLDDDDEFVPDRVEYLVSNYSDKFAFVATNTKVITKKSTFSMFTEKISKVISYDDLLWENVIGTQVLVKRERILSCNGFDTKLSSGQDVDMWLTLTKLYGPALRLKSCKYILHTEHDNLRITTSSKKIDGWFQVYDKYKKDRTNSQLKYAIIKIKYCDNKLLLILHLIISFNFNIYKFLLKRFFNNL